MLKFKMIIEAIDRATGPMRKAKASMSGMTQEHRRLAAAERAGYAAGARFRSGLGAMAGRLRQAGAAARGAAGRAGLAAWTKATELAQRGTGALIGKVGGLASGMAKWGVAAGTALAGWSLFDLFSTAGQFEQFQIQLEGMMGSAQKGKEAFGWIKKFAADTPYELAKVTESFLILKNAGLDPTKGGLAAAGDAAAGMSIDIAEAAKAMADAMTNEFERLKGLGITASVAGDRVRLTWQKNEKEYSKVVSTTDKMALAMAVAAAWSDKFAGSTKRQSTTMFGLISNLKDKWAEFQMMIADAGIFDLVKNSFAELLAKVNAMAESGELRAWAIDISKRLEEAFKWAKKFVTGPDGKQFLADLKAIGAAAVTVANAVLKIAENWRAVSFAMKLATGPIGWVGEGARRMLSGSKPSEPPAETGRFRASVPILRAPAMLRPRASADPIKLPGFAQPRARQAANDTQVGGLIRLQVEAKPGTSVRTAGIEGGNPRVPIRVDIGRSMAGAA